MKCKHTDCFTCPYPDCILDIRTATPKGKSDRYERNKRYYEKHKEEERLRNRERYLRRKNEQLRMDEEPKSN